MNYMYTRMLYEKNSYVRKFNNASPRVTKNSIVDCVCNPLPAIRDFL